MKKKVFLLSATMLSVVAFSQVGINTANPTSTLDVTAKNPTGSATTVDGLLVPRVDRQRAQSMTGVPTSTLVYINSIATGTQSGTTTNVDTTGYYYFDGTVWAKLNTGSGSPTAVNIYNSNGSLMGNRVVTQGANTLTFNSTAVNGFSVDGSTLSVDAANDRTGIGTTAPQEKLQVSGLSSSTPIGTSGVNKVGPTIRIDGLSQAYNGANLGANNVTRLAADVNGNVVLDSRPNVESLPGIDQAISIGVTPSSPYTTLATYTFNLTRPGLVWFYSVIRGNFYQNSGQTAMITDGGSRVPYYQILVDGNAVLGNYIGPNYSNSLTNGLLVNASMTNLNGQATLSPGQHTITVQGTVFGPSGGSGQSTYLRFDRVIISPMVIYK